SPFLSAPQPATVTLNSDANPVDVGMPLKLTGTVSAANAPGEVAFREGTTSLGAAKVSNGMAVLSLGGLAVGTHMITAIYSGGGTFSGSTSPALSEVVNPAASAVSLASSLNPSQPGQNVALTATVSSGFGI